MTRESNGSWRSSCERLDRELAGGRFGDAQYLSDNTAILYQGLRETIAVHISIPLPSLRSDLPYAIQVILRRTLDEAFAALVDGGLELATAKVKRFFEYGDVDGVRYRCARHDSSNLAILTDWTDDPFSEAIARAFVDSMGGEGLDIRIVAPRRDQIEMVAESVAAINSILPLTGPSTLGLVRGIALMEGAVPSAYINENPLTFLVNVDRFSDTLLLAETIFHEALHQKLVDIRLTSYLLTEGYDDKESEGRGDVSVPWPRIEMPRKWSSARALAAFHVYSHLVVLYATVLCRCDHEPVFGVLPDVIACRLEVSYERARYLALALARPICQSHFSVDGRELFGLLVRCLDALAGFPIRDGTLQQVATRWCVA